jgi:hypothetical protein
VRRHLVAVCVVAVAGLALTAPGAFGDPPGAPSCVGSGSSALAPGQAANPFAVPGARADVSRAVQAIADALGVPPGQVVKALAQQHGTAEECFPNGPPTAP